MKRKIAFGLLSVWMVIFCLSFCDELGVWVDIGRWADQAVEKIMASPSIELSSEDNHQDDKHIVFERDILFEPFVFWNSISNHLIALRHSSYQSFAHPPILETLSRLLI